MFCITCSKNGYKFFLLISRSVGGHPCKKIFFFGMQGSHVVPRKTRNVVYFFPQMCFYFRKQPTSHFNPFESMDLVKIGRKLSTFAKFLGKLKMSASKMASCTNQTVQLSFQKGILELSSSCSSFFICRMSYKVSSAPKRCHILLS